MIFSFYDSIVCQKENRSKFQNSRKYCFSETVDAGLATKAKPNNQALTLFKHENWIFVSFCENLRNMVQLQKEHKH